MLDCYSLIEILWAAVPREESVEEKSVGYTTFSMLNAYFYLLYMYLAVVGGDHQLVLEFSTCL